MMMPRVQDKKIDEKSRLNLVLDRNLKDWVQQYARRHHTTITTIITSHFVDLRKEEDGIGVEQI
jgi:hypothetical protein